jgi:hypothetical protein
MIMKPSLSHIAHVTCFMVILFSLAGNITAQVIAGSSILHNGYNEKYTVMTDRSIYAAGEKLSFAVFNLSDREIQKAGWSSVYYVELLKSDGTLVTGAKFQLLSWGTEGTILIPDNIATGIYFLCSYTRWMLNFSPSAFACNRIKIINPYMQGIDDQDTGSSVIPDAILSNDTSAVLKMPVSCKIEKSIYGNREKVIVSLEIPLYMKTASERYCITVTRPGAIDTNNAGIIRLNETSREEHHTLHYIPETEGLSLSGQILHKNNADAVKNAFVQLSMLNKDGDYLSYYTGGDGKFYFSLNPFIGQQDLFITAKNASGDPLDIRIDKDFTDHDGPLYSGAFILSGEERSFAVEMMINSQVNQAYAVKIDSTTDRIEQDSTGLYFYGKPLRTVYIDDFIALPTLGEVFFELVPEVNIVKRKGITQLVMTGHARNNTDLASYSPLVLMDRVPLSNLTDLLEVSPGKIQRIELINNLYVKGSIIYGGVVSIFSKKGDLGGINLPPNSSFYVFTGYYPKLSADDKKYTGSNADARIPDYRNCLYWNPAIFIKPGGNARLEFYTSDNKGDYEVIVRGLTPQGQVMEKRCRFTVK